MRSILKEHFGYEELSDTDFIARQEILSSHIEQSISDGDSTQYTRQLHAEVLKNIRRIKLGETPLERSLSSYV